MIMSIHYVVQEKRNPSNPDAEPKYYPVAKSLKPITRDYLVDDMVRNTSLTEEEASTGINYLFKAIPRFLELGFTVQLGKMGHFRIIFKSEGSETPEEATTDKILRKKLVFFCGKGIKNKVNGFVVEKYPEKTGV
jgi:nucleoid DNA-binding protein